MPKTEVSVTINAPLEKVFDAAADPEKMAQYISTAVLENAKGKPDELGSYSEWLYPVAGMKIHGKMTVSEVDKPRRLVHEMSGTMPGKWIWSLKQVGQAVKVDFCIEYTVPGGILGKIADKLFLSRMNQKNGVKAMQGLKAYCEK
jgi:coenzyme Q-binding protein COQ10